MRSFSFLASLMLLSGCVTQNGNYVRADGPSDPARMQLVMAQCRGAGARAVVDYVTGEGPIPWLVGTATRASKEETITNACMARSGYLAQ